MRTTWAALLLIAGIPLIASDSPTNRFGFTGPEIFPIEKQISSLKHADLDGDGKEDLLVVNNARSRLALLYNQTGTTNDPAALLERQRTDINELPPDARFRIDSISSEKRISSLLLTDLNNDSRPDIAYYGEPRELIIQFNEGTNKWSALKRYAIDDGTLDPYALVSGDLNGDELTDVLLLADSHIYVLYQKRDNSLGEPEKIPYIGTVKSIQVLDIQGDGRDDLLLVNWDNPNPFRFRLQNNSGRLGPEHHFQLPPIRSYWADDLDGDKKTEVITIARKSGRAQVSTFTKKPAEELLGNWKQGQLQLMPLLKTSKTRRGTVWADLNGDGRSDLLVAEPEAGQLTLYLQNESGSLEAPETFTTLTGVTDLLAQDWNGDGKPEIFLLSADERQIGFTQLDDKGRIAFPETLWMDGRPLAMASGRLKDEVMLATIVDLEGKRELQLRRHDGETVRRDLSENFKANPASMLMHDMDQDGLQDLIVLIPYEKIKILLQQADLQFKEIDVAPPGGNTDQPWVIAADVDGDGKSELLLPQRNFLRAVTLRSDERQNWTFQVKEQINASTSNSRIVAATAVPRKDNPPALFLLDAERKSLTVTQSDETGVWKVIRSISLPFTEFREMQPVAFGQSDANAVSFIGLNAVGWFDLAGDTWQLVELGGYETPIKDGYLHDVVSGDLNHDGRRDLAFIETQKSYVDLVTFDQQSALIPADRWQVFEERTFRNRRNDLPEPREAVIADVTGDGKNDLILVVHDRLLLYPQE